VKPILDDHGQPLEKALNASRRITRAIHELIGFMRGIIADDYPKEYNSRLRVFIDPQCAENGFPLGIGRHCLSFERGLPVLFRDEGGICRAKYNSNDTRVTGITNRESSCHSRSTLEGTNGRFEQHV